jgi:Kef-type K+ transport system membrane component KefB
MKSVSVMSVSLFAIDREVSLYTTPRAVQRFRTVSAMSDLDYLNVLVVAGIAVAAPLLAGAAPFALPEVVIQIVAGVVVGPSGLGLVDADGAVRTLAALGLAYLLFVSGMEIRATTLRGPMLPLSVRAFGISALVALAAALLLGGAGVVDNRGLIVATLITTSLGIVVAVLKELGEQESQMGQLTLVSAALGDVASVGLLSVIFAADPWQRAFLLGLFAIAVVALIATIMRIGGIQRVGGPLARGARQASHLYVRSTFAFMLGFAVVADLLGLEAILGAFAAGVVVSLLSEQLPDGPPAHGHVEAIGLGLLAPMFFVTSGIHFDLSALTGSGEGLVLVPVVFVAMVLCRLAPALAFGRVLGRRRSLVAGLLLSTKLTFVVAAVEIARQAGAVEAPVASALVAAAVLTVLVLPVLAVSVARPFRSA